MCYNITRMHQRLTRSLGKFIRRQKARIRRQTNDPKERERLVADFIKSLDLKRA